MREVCEQDVRAICEAGGEVTDEDGDVWCVLDGVFGYMGGLEHHQVLSSPAGVGCTGPFYVSKEPPTQWKRGVPESSGVYWCRVDDSDHEPTLVKLPESGGVYDFGCEENITESVADFEFCPEDVW